MLRSAVFGSRLSSSCVRSHGMCDDLLTQMPDFFGAVLGIVTLREAQAPADQLERIYVALASSLQSSFWGAFSDTSAEVASA